MEQAALPAQGWTGTSLSPLELASFCHSCPCSRPAVPALASSTSLRVCEVFNSQLSSRLEAKCALCPSGPQAAASSCLPGMRLNLSRRRLNLSHHVSLWKKSGGQALLQNPPSGPAPKNQHLGAGKQPLPLLQAWAGHGQLIPLLLSAGHRSWLHSNTDCSGLQFSKKKKNISVFLEPTSVRWKWGGGGGCLPPT